MTVEELIRALQACDPQTKVEVSIDVSRNEMEANKRVFCDLCEVMRVAGHVSLLCDNPTSNWE